MLKLKMNNNFIICSEDKNIKLWIKKRNKFIINQIIKDVHEDEVRKVIFFQNEL